MKKSVLLFILVANVSFGFSQVTRYWIGGGSAIFKDGTHWSMSSGGSAIGGTINWANTDIAIFDVNSGSPTVMFTSGETINKLQISGSITVTFTPNSTSSRTLTVGHTAASDNLTIAAVSTLVIKGLDAATDRNMTVATNNITGITASINGYIKVMDDATGYGRFNRQSPSMVTFNAGSTYEHNSAESSSNIPIATWAVTSSCLITGIKSAQPGNLDQSFGNFTWNCTNQNAALNISGIPYVRGNFIMNSTGSGSLALSVSTDVTMSILGNYTQNGGVFYPSNGSGDDVIYIGGNFSMTGGSLGSQSNGSTQLIFNKSGIQTYSQSGGTIYNYIHFNVQPGSTLDLGNSLLGNASYCTGNFTLNSGSGIKTQYSTGIRTEYNQGCIQLSGIKSFSTGASYTFYTNGDQFSGNALPSTVANIVVGSTTAHTHLTLNNIPNNSVTIPNGGKLTLIADASSYSTITASGGIIYNSGSTLEYTGLSSQPTTDVEYPPHPNGPSNLIVNNSIGVVINGNKTVKSTLTLTLGNLVLNGFTLNLNGAISKVGGGLTGSITSNIIIGGSGNTNLPGVILNDLTMNRPATIGLSGNVTVYGYCYMTQGSFNTTGFIFAYGSVGKLTYNGTIPQTTSDNEFPSTSGPYSLEISNSAGVNLHSSRTLYGNLILTSGNFIIGTSHLILNGPAISGTSTNLITSSNSSLTFGGNYPGIFVPSSVNQLSGFYVSNPNRVIFNNNLNFSVICLVSGFLDIGNFSLSGTGNFNLIPSATLATACSNGIVNCVLNTGSKIFSSYANYEFNSTSHSQTTNMPQFTPIQYSINTLKIASIGYSVGLNSDLTIQGSLIVEENAQLIIYPAKKLSVISATFLNGGNNLILQSDASGTSTFIDHGITYNNSSVSVDKYLSTNRWHFVSPPVSNALSGVYLDLYLKWFNETDSTWIYIEPTNIPFIAGQGYASWNDISNRDVTYQGFLNTGDININLTATDRNGGGIGAGEGWNLAGNPYPSAIDWNLIPLQNMQNLDPTVYVFDGAQYLCYPYLSGFGQLKDGIIPAQQSFFIKAIDFDPSLVINNLARVHGPNPYKNKKQVDYLLNITVEGLNYSDQMFVHFNANTTTGFDHGYDALKLPGISLAPQLYSLFQGNQLSINCLPYSPDITIPLSFKSGNESNYTIKFEGMESFQNTDDIYLEDIRNNITINLKDHYEYQFSSSILDDPHRFNLKFIKEQYVDESMINTFSVSCENGSIIISQSDLINEYNLQIFSLTGQEILRTGKINAKNYKYETGNGFYLVKITKVSENLVYKIIVQ